MEYVYLSEETVWNNLINLSHIFTMTTNGILLDRYLDFLVQHDFQLLISLDGNEKYIVKKI